MRSKMPVRLLLALLAAAAVPMGALPSHALPVCGNLLTNTVWTAADNPVTVTCDTYVYPGVTLQIDPGVNVVVTPPYGLVVRGKLNALGSVSSRITFRSSSTTTKWDGISVANNSGGAATLSFVDLSDANVAVSEQCCFGGSPVTILDSTLTNNQYGLAGYTGTRATIRRTTFSNHFAAVTQADKDIYDSTFTGNTYGLYATERVNVYSSTFTGNSTALYGGRGVVQNSTISGNSTGFQPFFEGFRLRKNTVTGNAVGIILPEQEVAYNNIHGNSAYNARNTSGSNQTVPNNWWGTTNTSVIDAGIHDGLDQAGLGIVNYDPIGTVPVTLDTTPPDTSVTASPPALTNSASASFSFASTETGSTFACSLDDSPFTGCSSPKGYSGLSDGSHTFRVQATDGDANTDPSPATFTWTVDTRAPDTTILTGPTGSANPPSASFGFSATEPGSTFLCALDGTAFAACTSPTGYSGLADGSHIFQVAAIDPAGNLDPSPAYRIWTSDGTPPIVTIRRPAAPGLYLNDTAIPLGGDTPIVAGPLTVEAHAKDAGSGVVSVAFEVDGVPVSPASVTYRPSTGDFSFTWTGYSPGSHTIRGLAADAAGNAGVASVMVIALVG